MGFDGTRYFVVVQEHPDQQTPPRVRAQFLDPRTGWVGQPVITSSGNPQGHAPHMIWTGDGFLLALSELGNTQCNGGTFCRNERVVHLIRFDATGAARQHLLLDNQGQGAIVPSLAWAGGRIALSWSSAPQQGPERRFLAFLSCAP